jgi:hypothetical protein
MSCRLGDALLDIQEGKVDDPFGWIIDAADCDVLAEFVNR